MNLPNSRIMHVDFVNAFTKLTKVTSLPTSTKISLAKQALELDNHVNNVRKMLQTDLIQDKDAVKALLSEEFNLTLSDIEVDSVAEFLSARDLVMLDGLLKQ